MLKEIFPIFSKRQNGKELIYLDTAATAQKPQAVINAVEKFYSYQNSNIERGTYFLEANATQMFENSRENIAEFINAEPSEIAFTSGATEGINLVTNAFNAHSDDDIFSLSQTDEILITQAEHHSNALPWFELAKKTGAKLRIMPTEKDGSITSQNAYKWINKNTKIVAITHASNVTGFTTNINPFVELCRKNNAILVLDACQSVPHIPVDVKALDIDFLVFSGHKVYGPTGIGILYGKKELLDSMPPVKVGGGTVNKVSLNNDKLDVIYKSAPFVLEAGTPAIASVIGLNEAVNFVSEIGFDKIIKHEQELLSELLKINDIDGVHILGAETVELGTVGSSAVGAKTIGSGAVGEQSSNAQNPSRLGVVSFIVDGIHPHDISQALDSFGIAVRAGHHCAQPIHENFSVSVSTRASIGIYNSIQDVQFFVNALQEVVKYFKK